MNFSGFVRVFFTNIRPVPPTFTGKKNIFPKNAFLTCNLWEDMV